MCFYSVLDTNARFSRPRCSRPCDKSSPSFFRVQAGVDSGAMDGIRRRRRQFYDEKDTGVRNIGMVTSSLEQSARHRRSGCLPERKFASSNLDRCFFFRVESSYCGETGEDVSYKRRERWSLRCENADPVLDTGREGQVPGER